MLGTFWGHKKSFRLYTLALSASSTSEMPNFKEVSTDDIDWFIKRSSNSTDVLHASKEFPVPFGERETIRYLYKRIEGVERLEVVEELGEHIISSSPAGQSQVRAKLFRDGSGRHGLLIQQFRGKDGGRPVSGHSMSFYDGEWDALLTFLGKLDFIDFSNPDSFRLYQSSVESPGIVSDDDRALLDSLKHLEGDERQSLIEGMRRAKSLTREDLDILSGRRDGLEVFREQLYTKDDWSEKHWQKFFDDNRWIFGYGLDYRFTGVLQKEAAVSDASVDQKNTVTTDFLMAATNFTVIVEMKTPSTALFRRAEVQRSRTWALSTPLMDAVSQILTQKAEWQVKARSKNYDENKQIIGQGAVDPKAILIVGRRLSFDGTDQDKEVKLNTFELFRRDSRNIEILTYDELYDRAFYVVNQRLPESDDRVKTMSVDELESSAFTEEAELDENPL